ncbi:cationic amino acid transporter 4-like [Clavelina lepadiformis]|uniref:cationic amino acid transporter 4-like n=1 Tax=Clavelina lepadiformis TaxID=159417 RepID=UPI004043233A
MKLKPLNLDSPKMSPGEEIISFLRNMFRKKGFPSKTFSSELRRCLSFADLLFLSYGAIVGGGIYFAMGPALHLAGPSVILSYVFAGTASTLSGLCYSELGTRIPVAGSSYQYAYTAIGELIGFLVGWNIVIGHAVGAAAGAKGCSQYIDAMFGNPIKKYMQVHLPMSGGLVATYPDFVAGGIMAVITVFVAFGIKTSTIINIIMTTGNALIFGFVMVSGIILGKTENIAGSESSGGFFPHGFTGCLAGAATLISAFEGYEILATVSEEAMNPLRDIPLSIVASVGSVTVLYAFVSIALVSLLPWYEIPVTSTFTVIYAKVGWTWAKYVITVGVVATTVGCCISLSTSVPRYLYAMARDGLLMPFLLKISERTGVPITATVMGGMLGVLLAVILTTEDLINLLSVGQLLACLSVAFALIKLRYSPVKVTAESSGSTPFTSSERHEEEASQEPSSPTSQTSLLEKKTGTPGTPKCQPAENEHRFIGWIRSFEPGSIPTALLLFCIVFTAGALALFIFGFKWVESWWFITLAVVFVTIALASLLLLYAFVRDDNFPTFKLPLVPLLPYITTLINLALLLSIQKDTWIRLSIWMGIGLIIYFSYGYRHSKLHKCLPKNDIHDVTRYINNHPIGDTNTEL